MTGLFEALTSVSEKEAEILNRAAKNEYIPLEDCLNAIFPDAKISKRADGTIVYDMSGEQ